MFSFAVIAFAAVLPARAVDIVTRDGKAYRNATVTSLESAGVGVMHSGGSTFIDFDNLPPDWQAIFGWTPEKSAARKAAQDEARADKPKQQPEIAAAKQPEPLGTGSSLKNKKEKPAVVPSLQAGPDEAKPRAGLGANTLQGATLIPPAAARIARPGEVRIRGYIAKVFENGILLTVIHTAPAGAGVPAGTSEGVPHSVFITGHPRAGELAIGELVECVAFRDAIEKIFGDPVARYKFAK